jgi:hypothetical protein
VLSGLFFGGSSLAAVAPVRFLTAAISQPAFLFSTRPAAWCAAHRKISGARRAAFLFAKKGAQKLTFVFRSIPKTDANLFRTQ